MVKSNEKEESVKVSFADGTPEEATKIKFSTKLGWLNKMLWGGSALLAFEHLWHGEVVPFFPFLTAVKTGEVAGMLQEMSTVSVLMAVLVTSVFDNRRSFWKMSLCDSTELDFREMGW